MPEDKISNPENGQNGGDAEECLNAAIPLHNDSPDRSILPNWAANGERGASTLTKIVFGGIFLVLFYTAYNVVPFFYYYFEFQNQMTALVPIADTMNDAQIRNRLGKTMKELDIPAEPADIKIDRRDHFIKLSLKYTEVFYISFQNKDYDIYKFRFEAEADGPF